MEVVRLHRRLKEAKSTVREGRPCQHGGEATSDDEMGLDAEDRREIDEVVASLVPDAPGDDGAPGAGGPEAAERVAKQREEVKRKLVLQATNLVKKKGKRRKQG